MKKKQIEILVNKLHIVLLMVLFCSIILSYFFRESKTLTKNQELTTFPELSLSNFFDGNYQSQFEQAMKDQFIFRDISIKLNVKMNAELRNIYSKTNSVLRGYRGEEGLVAYGKVYRMQGTDWLTNLPYVYNEETANLYRKKAKEINEFADTYKDVKVYVYYCSRAEDMNWFDESNQLSSFSYSNYLESLLNHKVKFGKMVFRDFSEYQDLMYKTDHHWNNKGASMGYTNILMMMSDDFDMGSTCSILRTDDFDNLLWEGSRARECGLTIPQKNIEAFMVDQYILEDHETWFGDKKQNIGLVQEYASGQINREIGFDQYLNYYGFESEVIKLHYPNKQDNLLILGDSFSRAIREPLASHFNDTIYVNYRILDTVDIEGIMENYQIDAVLFMGQQDAFSGYFLKGEE